MDSLNFIFRYKNKPVQSLANSVRKVGWSTAVPECDFWSGHLIAILEAELERADQGRTLP